MNLGDMRLPLAGGTIPALGFGTLIPDPDATSHAVVMALQTGFRLLDCAERYRNEEAVGEALRFAFRTGSVRREDITVVSKLWNNNHRPERVKAAFEASLDRLQLDHIDLYLVHTPYAFRPGDEQDPRDATGRIIYDDGVTLEETWQAMEHLVEGGRCAAIGVSDVDLGTLAALHRSARIKPAAVQVESHPYMPEWEMLDFCRRHDMVMMAFAALGHGIEPRLLDDPVIGEIGRQLGMTAAQILLSWALQRGTAPLTTSKTPSRIRENFAVAALPDDAMASIRDRVATRYRFNQVVQTGVPGFIPHGS